MKCLEEIINEEIKEIVDFKRIRYLINNYISTYTKVRTERVNNIRDLKKIILELSKYARIMTILYEEDENKRRELLDKIYKIENEIDKIEEDIISKDKSVAYINLIDNDFNEILSIFSKYLPKKDKYKKLDAYHQQNKQSSIIYS
jgi:hypothetical protein